MYGFNSDPTLNSTTREQDTARNKKNMKRRELLDIRDWDRSMLERLAQDCELLSSRSSHAECPL